MKLKHLIVLLPLIVGCAQSYWYDSADKTPKPNQAEAVKIVWNSYGLDTAIQVPTIAYIMPNCSYTSNGQIVIGFTDEYDGSCDQGISYPWDNISLLMDADPWVWHESPLAHELGHDASYFLTGDGDANHKGPYFAPNGYVWKANQLLTAAGL